MGEWGAFWKMQELLEQPLAQCEAEHIFQGAISEFETVGPVPKDRLTKGMLVDGDNRLHHVNFSLSLREGSGVNTSHLNVGESVIILGKQHSLRNTATFPILIMLPEKRKILLSRTPDDNRWGAPGDTIIAILYILGCAIGSIGIFGPFFLPMDFAYWGAIGIIALVSLLLFFGIIRYQNYTRRDRVLSFNSDEWNNVMVFMRNRLPVEKIEVLEYRM